MDARVRLRERLAEVFEVGGESSRRNLPMEGLRGLAVILVFFVHYHALFQSWVHQNAFSFACSHFLGTIGLSGVDLFFVISGYLIYGLVIRRRSPYLNFIKRRVQRIYPTFLCVLAVYLLLSLMFPAENKIPSGSLPAALYILENALLLPGLFDIQPIITVAWSLSYEFFFYLLIPTLVAVCFMRSWPKTLRVVFFLTVAALYSVYCLTGRFAHIHLIMFVSGILLYEAIHSYELNKRLTPHMDYLALLVFLLTFPAIYALTGQVELFPFLPSIGRIGIILRIVVLFVSFFIFTLACFTSTALLARIFSWTPLRWLGNMSYSYYLIHGLTLKAIALVAMHLIAPSRLSVIAFWLGLPSFFFITLISSAILFMLVEKRFSISPALMKAMKASKPDRAAASAQGGESLNVALPSEVNLPQRG